MKVTISYEDLQKIADILVDIERIKTEEINNIIEAGLQREGIFVYWNKESDNCMIQAEGIAINE